MKKSKLILLAVISLIFIAIFNEIYIHTSKIGSSSNKNDSLVTLNDSIRINNAQIKNILGTDFTLSLGVKTKGKIKYINNNNDRRDSSIFHINDIDIYLNEPANRAIFICKGKEKEAFYHIKAIIGDAYEDDGVSVNDMRYFGTTEKYYPSELERCFTQREKKFSCITQIRGEDLTKIIEILNWYKTRLYGSNTTKFLIKPIPANYIDSIGKFIDQEPNDDPISVARAEQEEKERIREKERIQAEQEEKDKYYDGGAPDRFKKAKKFSF